MYRTGQVDSKNEVVTIHDGVDIKDIELLENFKKRDTKVPFIVAMDEEDTPEDLEKFGVDLIQVNDLIVLALLGLVGLSS